MKMDVQFVRDIMLVISYGFEDGDHDQLLGNKWRSVNYENALEKV